MLKLNIGFNRKVGEANFSSRGASVNLEIEVESGLVREPGKLQAKIDYLFGLAKSSVDVQLNGNGHLEATSTASTSNGNGSHGNGNSRLLVSLCGTVVHVPAWSVCFCRLFVLLDCSRNGGSVLGNGEVAGFGNVVETRKRRPCGDGDNCGQNGVKPVSHFASSHFGVAHARSRIPSTL